MCEGLTIFKLNLIDCNVVKVVVSKSLNLDKLPFNEQAKREPTALTGFEPMVEPGAVYRDFTIQPNLNDFLPDWNG